MQTILRTEHIVKDFYTGSQVTHALSDITINVEPGKLTLLRGRSGSGKTTLMNILGALDKPTDGSVFFLPPGSDKELIVTSLGEVGQTRFRRKNVGFIFQSVALISVMTALENVDFSLRIAGYPAKEREKRAKEVLEFVGLGPRMKHLPTEMSGGEQQRVAIARAIAHKPAIIFADEPTAELDTHTGLQVMALFRELIDKDGLTILMTTHDPNMMELADNVYELSDGVIKNE